MGRLRDAWRAFRGYAAAQDVRSSAQWAPSGGSATTEVGAAAATVARRARDAVRNDPYATRIVDLWTGNAVGAGITTRWPGRAHADAWRRWAESTACDAEGRREIVGLHIGPSEAETFWAAFLKSLVKRGLKGVKLVASDAHEGLKTAIARVLGATWQRCRVHWMRNALAHVGRAQQSMASAALRQAFLQPDQAGARQTWRHVADQLRPRWPKLGKLMDDTEDDVLAYMAFPAQHRTKRHSVNTLERLNKEVKRRADVVGIFPSEASIIRLIGAVLLEANDEWQMQHRYMGVEAMAGMPSPSAHDPPQIPPRAACAVTTSAPPAISTTSTDVTNWTSRRTHGCGAG